MMLSSSNRGTSSPSPLNLDAQALERMEAAAGEPDDADERLQRAAVRWGVWKYSHKVRTKHRLSTATQITPGWFT